MIKFDQHSKFDLVIGSDREYLINIFRKVFDLKKLEVLVIKEIKRDERSSVYKYELEFSDSKDNWQKKVAYGTVRSDQEQHERIFSLLKLIEESGMRDTIPQPLYFDKKNSYHLENEVSGIRLLDALNVQNYRDCYEDLIVKTANWLVTFHKLDFKKIPFPHGWEEEERDLKEVMEGQIGWLKKILPRYSKQTERLIDEIFTWHKSFYSEKNLSFVHNDFCTGNIMVRPDFGIGVFDFSDARISDVMCDVASFTLRLKMNAIKFPPGYRKFDLSLEESDHFTKIFMENYFKGRGYEFSKETAARFWFWQAHFALRFLAMFAVEAKKAGGEPKLLRDSRLWLEKATSAVS